MSESLILASFKHSFCINTNWGMWSDDTAGCQTWTEDYAISFCKTCDMFPLKYKPKTSYICRQVLPSLYRRSIPTFHYLYFVLSSLYTIISLMVNLLHLITWLKWAWNDLRHTSLLDGLWKVWTCHMTEYRQLLQAYWGTRLLKMAYGSVCVDVYWS